MKEKAVKSDKVISGEQSVGADGVDPWFGHNLRNARLIESVEYVSVSKLREHGKSARRHPKRQLKSLCRNIEQFGFIVPLLIDEHNTVICGHARLQAARILGCSEVPIIRVSHLSEADTRAFRIADNRLAELAEWDQEVLAIELQDLVEIDYELELTGFETPEVERIIDIQIDCKAENLGDCIPDLEQPAVTQQGDTWHLDEHIVVCADARNPGAYSAVLGRRPAQMVFTDPPYNVRIDKNACGSGAIRHREFVMASGEMSDREYAEFLCQCIGNLVRFSEDGSVHFICIDWRHLHELSAICEEFYEAQLNLCVWVKTNGGMGSLYRSQHELVLVYRNGNAAHINNVQLGKYKRNRTNVWRYEGVNTLNSDRRKDLALHPTVKPVGMVADAIRDCSKPNGIVLDPFLGAGTTLIACEETGRICCGLELDPLYIDVAIRRWQAYTGGHAVLAATGQHFDELTAGKARTPLLLPPPDKGISEEDA